jgi:hypothetical protein
MANRRTIKRRTGKRRSLGGDSKIASSLFKGVNVPANESNVNLSSPEKPAITHNLYPIHIDKPYVGLHPNTIRLATRNSEKPSGGLMNNYVNKGVKYPKRTFLESARSFFARKSSPRKSSPRKSSPRKSSPTVRE